MTAKRVAPYGSWESPITADRVVAGTLSLGRIVIDGTNVYWTEGRPEERGRVTVMRQGMEGRAEEVTGSPFNVRTRVHEYGGGAYTVDDGTVYFCEFTDQKLYRREPGRDPEPITAEEGLRYADMVVDRPRKRLIAVREDHRDTEREPVNTIVAVNLTGDERREDVLLSGNDFYTSPRISPDGTFLAWLTWNHPNMPWDGTELWVAAIQADGSLGRRRRVAGGPRESIFQPEWSPGGTLHFVSDRTGWWNLYRWQSDRIETLTDMEAEFGLPQWQLGMSTYGFESDRRIVCAFARDGGWSLATLDTETRRLQLVDQPYTEMDGVRVGPGFAAFRAGSPTEPLSIVKMDTEARRLTVVRKSAGTSVSGTAVSPGYFSVPEAIGYPTEGGATAHAVYYPPHNADYEAMEAERPPLLVMSHGGPTAATRTALNLGIQYWTSRGIAVVDVNYGGSTGYGRAYRERLNGEWGIVDVNDCLNAVRHLIDQGRADADRVMIRGGSAGGYTTLAALTFTDAFRAGASHFGVSDIAILARETHKFESRYMETLIGPYPEAEETYAERSPIHHAERLTSPVIFFQGLDDEVVPPNQAEMMVEELRSKGVPVAYLTFEEEGHGFRDAANLKRTLEAELYFYARVLRFPIADDIEAIEIENLDESSR